MINSGVYNHPIEVTKAHIDVNSHVNNVVYVQWMQDVAYSHSQAAGYDNQALEELGSTWVIRSHFVRYHRPALLGDELIAHTWLKNIKRASALRAYKFVRASDKAVVASGESDWVYIDRNTGRPKAIEDEMLEAFPVVADQDAP
ncbi:acyl-CoA thioesterase [Pelagicoccus mobilis]|uniref:Acyl-CoA thioesterase n=1 Tax=Pelagicoccus mobilis TaxID=415221 RepID=A0A934RXH9_9BACT|nr:thioesterase family protein [Pelagicoccus mobilis]MBK1877034.1 acyl-CoA thioesterase [Pelagicoccus mobilis]